AEQLAEDLADLRRRCEVGIRIVRRVIGGVGARHEVVEPLHQAAVVAMGCVTGRERTISTTPATSSGIDSSCPIVAPAHRKPRNASGSRKNSPMMRATA